MSSLGNKAIMAKNIRYYMSVADVNQTEICNTLGIKMPTFSDWVNAKTYPRIDKIELMANYFGISKADLVEERTEQEYTSALTPSERQLLKVYGSLNNEGQEKVMEYTEDLAASGRYKKHNPVRLDKEA